MSRLTDQENKKLTVDQFNAQAKQNALAQALSLTDKYWEKWKTQPASSGGGNGGSSKKKDTSYDRDDWFVQGAKGQYVLKDNSTQGLMDFAAANGGLKLVTGADGQTHLALKDGTRVL